MSLTRYFITGVQGFVGRYLVSHILKSDETAQIEGIGRSPLLNANFTHGVRCRGQLIPAPLPAEVSNDGNDRYHYFRMDLHDRRVLATALRTVKPDVLIHLASGLRGDSPTRLFRTNLEGTIDLLEALADSDVSVRKVIIGSTGGVYGVPETLPIDEHASCNPIDYYSISKLAAEHASRLMACQRNLPVIWARLFNLMGPGQDERHICGRLVSQSAAIVEGVSLPVIEVESLHTTRDFIDVRDVASALLTIAQRGSPRFIYNIASGKEMRAGTILELILRTAGLEGRVRIIQSGERPVEIPRHFASIDQLRMLGFECRYSVQQSISDLLAYYRQLYESHRCSGGAL